LDDEQAQEKLKEYEHVTRRKKLNTCKAFLNALKWADNWVFESYDKPGVQWKYRMLLRDAPWRRKPASKKQAEFLAKIGIVFTASYDQDLLESIIQSDDEGHSSQKNSDSRRQAVQMEYEKLTKGMAADLITRYKFGAIGHARQMHRKLKKQDDLLKKIASQGKNSLE
jgi:hypothetical protein